MARTIRKRWTPVNVVLSEDEKYIESCEYAIQKRLQGECSCHMCLAISKSKKIERKARRSQEKRQWKNEINHSS